MSEVNIPPIELNKENEVLERSFQVTKSLTNAYNTCFNFDLDTGTFSSLKGGDYLTYMSRSCGTELVLQNWLSMLPERSVDIMTAFLDFDTIDSRMRNRNSISCEYLDAIGKWMRATLIVSDRNEETGHISSVTLATEDIDLEKSNELEWKKAVRERINLLSSVAKVYHSMYHVDFKNDVLRELSAEQTDRFYGLPLHQAWKLWIIKDFSPETYERYKDFLRFDDVPKRLKERGVLSEDILTIPYGWMNFIVAPYRKDRNGNVVDALIMTRIIDKQKKKEIMQAEALRIATESAFMDGLTGIKNRTALKNYMSEYDLNKEEMYVALFDIDKFKDYNDTYGHVMGDDALRAFAETLSRIATQEDAFCCRYGGEEFVLITRGKTQAEAAAILKKISKDLLDKKIAHVKGPVGVLSVSVGFAERAGVEDIVDTVRRADDALYYSKTNGRNRITFASVDMKSGQRLFDVTFAPTSRTYIAKNTEKTEKSQIDELTEALKIRSRQLDVVLNAIPGGIITCKAEAPFTLQYISKEAAEMFGYTIEEFKEYTQNSAIMACIPEDRAALNDEFHQQLKKDRHLLEYRVLCKDGTLKYVVHSGKKVVDSDGEEVIYSVYLDITDEKKREEASRTASAFKALSVDYDALSFFNFEKDSFNDFYVSDKYAEVSAKWRNAPSLYSRLKIYIENMVYEPDQERVTAMLLAENVYKSLESKRAYYINYRIYRKDGTIARAQMKLVKDTTDPTGKTVIMCYINLDESGKRKEE